MSVNTKEGWSRPQLKLQYHGLPRCCHFDVRGKQKSGPTFTRSVSEHISENVCTCEDVYM